MSKKVPSFVRSNGEGRLYIDEVAFFSDPKVKEVIRKLLNSETYKRIKKGIYTAN